MPNNAETFGAVKGDLLKMFPGAKLEHRTSPQELFTVIVKLPRPDPITELLESLGAASIAPS